MEERGSKGVGLWLGLTHIGESGEVRFWANPYNYAGIIVPAEDERHAGGRGCTARAGSHGLPRLPRLPSLRALAKNPFAHIGRALNQFNALIFAPDQKTDHPEIH
jgi:hypothetical protein